MATSTVTVFVCNGTTSTQSVALSGDQYGACQSGQGSWQQVLIETPFDPATLDSSELGSAFGAGFTVMGTGLVIVWAAKQIVRAIRSATS